MPGMENRDWLVRPLWQNLAEPSGAGRTWRNPQAQSRELSELRRTIKFHLYIHNKNKASINQPFTPYYCNSRRYIFKESTPTHRPLILYISPLDVQGTNPYV